MHLSCIFVLAAMLACTMHGQAAARLIPAGPSDYTSRLGLLAPGDTLLLAPGAYTKNLTLKNINGTATDPVVIMGSGDATAFQAQSCCNTVSITQCSYVIISDLLLDGMNVPVDAVKGEGTAGNWAHHITLERLHIVGYGNDQQIVGISTKCHAWNWVIRRNRIVGAGTGMYLGNSNGDNPFVNGLIEYNLITNTIGYNIQIKHQLDTVRKAFAGTAVDGKTIIRYNVFCKDSNAATGANARPNLLVGAFPATGPGSGDYYEVYGNFFYQNPVEALLQATGNIALYNNVFVNHYDPSGIRAVYITTQNGFQPRQVRVFHNTVWVANSSGGIRLYNPNPAYRQYCYGNAVFAAQPVTNFTDTAGNITDTYANASAHVLSATNGLGTLDLYPRSGRLAGQVVPDSLFRLFTDWIVDFNGDTTDWTFRGAYSGCCLNKGWHLALDTMPARARRQSSPVRDDLPRGISGPAVYPNPATGIFHVRIPDGASGVVAVCVNQATGTQVYCRVQPTDGSGIVALDASDWNPGVYFVRVLSGGKLYAMKVVVR